MRTATHENVMRATRHTHECDACATSHTWTHTHECAESHMWTHTYECAKSHIWMRKVTHENAMHASRHTYECDRGATSHTSTHTHDCTKSHMRMHSVTQTNVRHTLRDSHQSAQPHMCTHPCTHVRKTHMNTPTHTCAENTYEHAHAHISPTFLTHVHQLCWKTTILSALHFLTYLGFNPARTKEAPSYTYKCATLHI